MSRIEISSREPFVQKKHESSMQALRHERKSEGRRLAGLKKILESRLSDSKISDMRAA